MTVIAAPVLEAIYRAVAKAHGADEPEARAFSACLVRADLRGHSLQGAALLPYLDEMIADGQMHFGAPLEVVREGPGTAAVDAHFEVGQVVGTRCMGMAIEKARTVGIACVTARNAGDFAMAAAYALQASDQGLIGVSMSNGKPLVAPWGGRDAMLCTNPLSFAFPAGHHAPVVIDMATSAFSMGQVVRAARDGRMLRSIGVVDVDGNYGEDPTKVVLDSANRESQLAGALLPLGAKGFCWMLIVELLCAAMAGSAGSPSNAFEPSAERPWDLGQVFIAVSVDHFRERSEFEASVDELADRLGEARAAPGMDGVRIPGREAAREEQRRRRDGVPLRNEEWELVRAVALRRDAGALVEGVE